MIKAEERCKRTGMGSKEPEPCSSIKNRLETLNW